MSRAALGQVGGSSGLIDVHAGGVDLKFPHHENEVCVCVKGSGVEGSGGDVCMYFYSVATTV